LGGFRLQVSTSYISVAGSNNVTLSESGTEFLVGPNAQSSATRDPLTGLTGGPAMTGIRLQLAADGSYLSCGAQVSGPQENLSLQALTVTKQESTAAIFHIFYLNMFGSSSETPSVTVRFNLTTVEARSGRLTTNQDLAVKFSASTLLRNPFPGTVSPQDVWNQIRFVVNPALFVTGVSSEVAFKISDNNIDPAATETNPYDLQSTTLVATRGWEWGFFRGSLLGYLLKDLGKNYGLDFAVKISAYPLWAEVGGPHILGGDFKKITEGTYMIKRVQGEAATPFILTHFDPEEDVPLDCKIDVRIIDYGLLSPSEVIPSRSDVYPSRINLEIRPRGSFVGVTSIIFTLFDQYKHSSAQYVIKLNVTGEN
jgi:hypothetical protein